jgi:hypothetical protein
MFSRFRKSNNINCNTVGLNETKRKKYKTSFLSELRGSKLINHKEHKGHEEKQKIKNLSLVYFVILVVKKS